MPKFWLLSIDIIASRKKKLIITEKRKLQKLKTKASMNFGGNSYPR